MLSPDATSVFSVSVISYTILLFISVTTVSLCIIPSLTAFENSIGVNVVAFTWSPVDSSKYFVSVIGITTPIGTALSLITLPFNAQASSVLSLVAYLFSI